jgi:hypothetical protein
MGLNADNLFARCSDPKAVLDHLVALLKRKVAVSRAQHGWVQAISAGEISPPEVAQRLSVLIEDDVVCAQLYEVSGDVGWALFRAGKEVERFHSGTCADPAGVLAAALRRLGIPFPVRLFRHLLVLKDEGTRTREPAA